VATATGEGELALLAKPVSVAELVDRASETLAADAVQVTAKQLTPDRRAAGTASIRTRRPCRQSRFQG
jgi:hypothetical protein